MFLVSRLNFYTNKVAVAQGGNMVGREGLEPSKAEPADLQSAPFDHFGTDPQFQFASHKVDTERIITKSE